MYVRETFEMNVHFKFFLAVNESQIEKKDLGSVVRSIKKGDSLKKKKIEEILNHGW